MNLDLDILILDNLWFQFAHERNVTHPLIQILRLLHHCGSRLWLSFDHFSFGGKKTLYFFHKFRDFFSSFVHCKHHCFFSFKNGSQKYNTCVGRNANVICMFNRYGFDIGTFIFIHININTEMFFFFAVNQKNKFIKINLSPE